MYLVKFRNPLWNIFSEILSQGSFILLLIMSQVYLVQHNAHPLQKEWLHLKSSRNVKLKDKIKEKAVGIFMACCAEAVLFLESYGFGSVNLLSLLLASPVVIVLLILIVGVWNLDHPCPGTRKASSFGTFNSKLKKLSCNHNIIFNWISLKLILK